MRETAKTTLVEGLVAGLIGYASVAIVFLVANLMAGRPALFTAEVLGSAILNGNGGPGAVLAFNGLHMVASLVIGMAAAWLLYETALRPRFWFAVLFLFVAGFILSTVVAGVFAVELTGAAPWWTVLTANGVAALLAGGYLWSQHPGLGSQIGGVGEF